ncbi:hypothetical protein, partial [Sinorhizobium meliloti]|uniref:hypothetical protein n=1 Tax=Rhizobium meliloti TaxID=382 RepID=UPI003D648707
MRGSALSISFATAEASPIAQMSVGFTIIGMWHGRRWPGDHSAFAPSRGVARCVGIPELLSPSLSSGEIDLLGRVFEQ